MYLKLLGCKILEREIASVVANCSNTIDVTMIRQKLHDIPEQLNKALQEEIDAIDHNRHRYSNDTSLQDYDAILIGYGLCSNALVGLSSRKYKLVVPKAHDCVTLLMGSRTEYRRYFEQNPGTFYYWPEVIELGALNDDDVKERKFRMYLERSKGNEKKARRLVEIEGELTAGYKRLSYIKWPEIDSKRFEEKSREIAEKKSWNYETYDGSSSLMRKLVEGEWNPEDFLVAEPGQTIAADYGGEILTVI